MKTTLFLICTVVVLCSSSKDGRIIGGSNAPHGHYSFAAAVYKQTAEGRYFCGGALIGSRFILTAGQCVDGAISFTVYLGTKNIKNLDGTAREFATEEYFIHPDYNPLTLENDIGVIKLRMDIIFNQYILPVALAPEPLTNGTGVRVVGWGQTGDEEAGLSDELQMVPLSTLTNQECKITYGNQITDQMVCAANNYNGGICNGDIGGPLLYYYLGYQAFLHGVSSFVSGNGCESPDPSGYTRTYPYIDWIRNVTVIEE